MKQMYRKITAQPIMLKTVLLIILFAVVSTAALAQPYRSRTLLRSVYGGKKHTLPVFALKTNLLYDALTNINLGFEVRLGDRMSLDVPLNYNPWVFSENMRFNNILIQPELRYWLAEPFNGHYFGFHLHFAHYNTGKITAPFGLWKEWQTNRYQGDLWGIGLAYGYQWILSQRWNIETTVGFGYFHAQYDRFDCPTCGDRTGRGLTNNYFGPTKAGISLIYIIQ